MTVTELQALFETQLAAGANRLYFMKQQTQTETGQITVSVESHDTTQASFDDLLASLNTYTLDHVVGHDNWPLFLKDSK